MHVRRVFYLAKRREGGLRVIVYFEKVGESIKQEFVKFELEFVFIEAWVAIPTAFLKSAGFEIVNLDSFIGFVDIDVIDYAEDWDVLESNVVGGEIDFGASVFMAQNWRESFEASFERNDTALEEIV